LYFDHPQDWPSLSAWLPKLPPEEDQRRWAGNSGLYLMHQACLFVDDIFAQIQKPTLDLKVLDYGCGWGRLIRFLYNRVRLSNIYGVDPWPPSFDRMAATGVHGQFERVDYIPKTLPFREKFDLVYLFSVFTHVGERSQRAILDLLRRHIAEDGLLAVTIRQANYWQSAAWPDQVTRETLLADHFQSGFAFVAHGSSEDGHQTDDYGDTSQTIDYIRRVWTDWRLERVGWRMADEYQIVAYLRPA